MRYLIDTALDYGLGKIASRTLENESVHGIIVDIHPYWLWLYSKFLTSTEKANRWFYRRYRMAPEYDFAYFSAQVPIDLRWKSNDWKYEMGDKSNLVVRIQLIPGSRRMELNFDNSPLNIVQEYAPIPELSSGSKKSRPLEGGVSIGHSSDAPGTLGGILADSYGQKYVLTCGHVIKTVSYIVDQPSSIDDPSTARIGTCKYVTSLTPSGGKLCNPQNTAVLNDLDIALIEVDGAISADFSVKSVGKIDGYTLANMLHPGLKVEYNGRSSGHRNLVIGGIGFVQQFRGASSGTEYCFKDLIEVKFPSTTTLALKRPVKPGDSGAWLVSSGASGLEWSGMIIGQNRQAGYAILSEDISSHLAAKGYTLQCH